MGVVPLHIHTRQNPQSKPPTSTHMQPCVDLTTHTQDGMVELPDMYATASSEALLSGRKPPYRLFVRPSRGAVPDDVCVLGAVSEPFVVATKRVRTAGMYWLRENGGVLAKGGCSGRRGWFGVCIVTIGIYNHMYTDVSITHMNIDVHLLSIPIPHQYPSALSPSQPLSTPLTPPCIHTPLSLPCIHTPLSLPLMPTQARWNSHV